MIWLNRQLCKLRKAWKSWSVNAGALIAAAGVVQDNIRSVVPPEHVGKALIVIGLVVVALRFKTNNSLVDK